MSRTKREGAQRERLFSGVRTFIPKEGGYASLPFIMRRAQFLFSARAWQIYSYVLMHIRPSGIGWVTPKEMAWDLDYKNLSKLRTYINALVKDGWLMHETSASRDYFLAPHPVDVLAKFREHGKIEVERLEAINELLAALKWASLGESGGKKVERSKR